MPAEAAGVKKIIIACGRTDLRKRIDGLAQLTGTKYDLNLFEKDPVSFLWEPVRPNQRPSLGRGRLSAFI